MKRIYTLLLVLVVLLTSCGMPHGGRILFSTDEQVADQRLENILDALKRQDKSAVKSMFSRQALIEAVNFDEHLDYLFDFFQGDVLSWEAPYGIGGSGDKEYGHYTKKRIDAWYTVNTDQGNYIFIFIDYSIDTENPDHAGLYTLHVIREEDEYIEFTSFEDIEKIPGIYKPAQTANRERLSDTDERVSDQRFESILDALKRQDKSAIKSMFSKQALTEAVDFDVHLDYLFEFFQGEVLSWNGPFGTTYKTGEDEHGKKICAWYQVDTDKHPYLFIFIDCPVDTKDSNHVGLYALRVIREEDEYTEFTSFDDIEIPGIYKPE